MKCQCGNENAIRIHGEWQRQEKEGRRYVEFCERCGDLLTLSFSDVYWDGKPEPCLADDPRTGQPRVFLSRAQKAQYLKENGLREAGDRVRGAPKHYDHSNSHPVDRAANREAARKALAEVRKMGAQYRRDKFLEIKRRAESL